MRRGFTLVEILAVVALIALVFITTAPTLVGVAGTGSLDAATERFIDLDARARLLASTGCGAVLEQDDGGWVVRSGAADGSDPVAQWRPRGVSISLRSLQGDIITGIRYNTRGRSVDYLARIDHDGGFRRVSVAGLTGWVVEETHGGGA